MANDDNDALERERDLLILEHEVHPRVQGSTADIAIRVPDQGTLSAERAVHN
jgi:hypothetical protein